MSVRVLALCLFALLVIGMPLVVQVGGYRAIRKVSVAGRKWAVVDSDRKGLFRVLIVGDDAVAVYREGRLERSWRIAHIDSVRCARVTGDVKTRPFSGFEILVAGDRPAKFYIPSPWNAWGVDKRKTERVVAAIQARLGSSAG